MNLIEVVAQFGRPGFDGRWDGWLLFRGFWIFLLIGAVVTALILTIRRRDDDPLRRAARRYAGGRIERVEFERIQADLRAAETGTTPVVAGLAATEKVPADEPPEVATD